MNLSDEVRALKKCVAELTKLILNARGTGGGGGEANTASNQGVGGVGLYHSKVGVDLQFKNINAGSSKVTVTNDPANKEVDIDVVVANLGHDILSAPHLDATPAAVLRGALITGQGAVPTWARLPIGAAGYLLRSDGTDIAWDDISGVGGAPDDAEYIVGAANVDLLNERVKPALYDNFDLEDYPAAPSAWDDEFEDGAIDPKWTLVNDPGAPRSFSETKFPGFLWVGLEDATANFDNLVRAYQTTIPSSAARWMFIARVAVGHILNNVGDYTHAGVYLADSAGKDAVISCIQLTPVTDAAVAGMARLIAIDNNVYVAATTDRRQHVNLTAFVWVGLSLETFNAYTAANDYWAWMSVDGVVWHMIGLRTFTFSNAPDQIGVCFRKPGAINSESEAACGSFRKYV